MPDVYLFLEKRREEKRREEKRREETPALKLPCAGVFFRYLLSE